MERSVWAWLLLCLLSTAYVAWDNFGRGNPEPTVTRTGWILITLVQAENSERF